MPNDVSSKLLLAAHLGATKLPAEAADALEEILTIETMMVIAGCAAIWAASHAVGLGFAADVVLIGVTVAAVGADAIKAASSFYTFYQRASTAATENDFQAAGDAFASGVTTVGVNVVLALFARRAVKTKAQVKIKPPAAFLLALERRWLQIADDVVFSVPKNQGMLWSKLGHWTPQLDYPSIPLARNKGLIALETILEEKGILRMYRTQFGKNYKETQALGLDAVTAKFWLRVSQRYAASLEGKVTTFTHNPKLNQDILAGKSSSTVLLDELDEISDLMRSNGKVSSVEFVDVTSGRTWFMTRDDVLKAARGESLSPTRGH